MQSCVGGYYPRRDATWPRDYHCRRNMFSLNEHVNPAERDWVYSVYRKPLWPLYQYNSLAEKNKFYIELHGGRGKRWRNVPERHLLNFIMCCEFVHSQFSGRMREWKRVWDVSNTWWYTLRTNNNHGNLWFSKLYVVFSCFVGVKSGVDCQPPNGLRQPEAKYRRLQNSPY